MSHKILLTFIVLSTLSIAGLTLNIFDTPTVEAEKTEGIAEISTKPSIVALAAVMNNFRTSLSSELLDAASFPLGHKESYSWTNFPPGMGGDRGGVRFGRLSSEQLTLFYEVLDAFLSDDGYTKVSLITKDVETHLSRIRPGFWDPNSYYIALFGNPETDGSWGFQLDGHHLALNFLVHGDEVSIVPAFIGSEPATINGIEVLADERGKAFALMNSLDASQREKAIQTGRRGLQVGAGNSSDPFLNYDYSDFVGIGLKASEMNDTQKENLRNLIKTYVYNLETEFADIWMADIDAGLDMTPISSGSEAPLQTIRFTTVFSIRLSGLNLTTKAVSVEVDAVAVVEVGVIEKTVPVQMTMGPAVVWITSIRLPDRRTGKTTAFLP